MCHLAPDFLLELPGRAVWIDAKYKDHLRRLAVQNWSALPEALRESHRADLHQALAYAMFAEAPRVDTFLVYPGTLGPAGEPAAPEPVFALADLVAGGRQVRLGLGSIPFGFQGPAHREQVVVAWEKVLRDSA
jgi:5-methylcytosine-specific restriction endonuclease McrBC regulatory subunit McrC